MKKFSFDDQGNLTVVESLEGVDADGKAVTMTAQHDIQVEQLDRHLPMFEAHMTAVELERARAIIAAQA